MIKNASERQNINKICQKLLTNNIFGDTLYISMKKARKTMQSSMFAKAYFYFYFYFAV